LNRQRDAAGCRRALPLWRGMPGSQFAAWRADDADEADWLGAALLQLLVGLKPACHCARPARVPAPGPVGPIPCGTDRLCWTAARHDEPVEVPVSTSGADSSAGAVIQPRLSAAQLLAAKHTRPIRSLDDLAADTFESDEELQEFRAFTYAERHRDLA
jgi:hypothetical protein